MASATLTLQTVFGRLKVGQMTGPVLILLILAMMVLPLPPFALDLLFIQYRNFRDCDAGGDECCQAT